MFGEETARVRSAHWNTSSTATRSAGSRAPSAPSSISSASSAAMPKESRALESEVVAPPRARACHVTAVGQVYPRSLDFRVVACLCDLASGPAKFRQTLRLMAGHELASEGFARRPDRLVRHAAQDEQPLVRAHQRLPRHPQGPPHHGRRARRRLNGTRAMFPARSCAVSCCLMLSSRRWPP